MISGRVLANCNIMCSIASRNDFVFRIIKIGGNVIFMGFFLGGSGKSTAFYAGSLGTSFAGSAAHVFLWVWDVVL